MDLSIVVPTYNVENYLANCLDSLLDQNISSDSYEILIINDGSTDNSGQIAEEYADRFDSVHVHNQVNQGLSAARNKGMNLARGTYIYFIDSDDYIPSNTLSPIMEKLVKNNLDILGLGVKTTAELDDYTSSNLDEFVNRSAKVIDGITFIAEHNYLNNAWWYFIRREFLLATGLTFPVGRYVEDANFTAQLFAKAKRVAYMKLDFYRYYNRPNSIMRKRTEAHYRKMISDYEKNAMDFRDQIRELGSTEHPRIGDCLKRLKARQESFVFFMLIRCIEIKMSTLEFHKILDRLEQNEVYPLKHFISEDFNKPHYHIILFILNRRYLIKPALKIYQYIPIGHINK